jgi:hypothetical protein
MHQSDWIQIAVCAHQRKKQAKQFPLSGICDGCERWQGEHRTERAALELAKSLSARTYAKPEQSEG